MGLEVLLQKQLILNYQSKIIFGCCMRKESQHYQIPDNPLPNITHQCQETTKKFKRLNQIKSKNDFIDWLRSLPFQIRYLAVKVEAPGLAQCLRQALRRLQFKNDTIDPRKPTNKTQKNILDSIVFTSDGRQFFDSICFDFNLIQFPERLYQLLMYSGQNVKKFNPIEDMQKNRKHIPDSCQQIKYIKTKEQLCKTLIRILRHEVFFNTCHKQQIQINDQKNRKKQLSFYWKNMTEQQKHQLLYLKNKNLKQTITYLSTKQIIVTTQQLQKQVAHLLKLEKNQFVNRIFKCKLKKSLTSITDYHELVYKLWKQQYQKSRKRKNKRSFNIQSLKMQQKYVQRQKQQKMNYSHMKSKRIIQNEKQNSIYSFQTNQTEIYQKLEETVMKKTLFKQSYLNDFIQKKIYQNIAQFSDYISKQANLFHKARLIAYQRIKFILQYYGIPIKIFGSCANGIAIKNSDIDIAIDNSILNYFNYCEDEHKVKFSLEWLQGILSNFKCMKNIKFIKSASIPIIKLSLDTGELFELNQMFFNFDIGPYLKKLNRPHHPSTIQIDLTVQTHSQNLKCNHLGINTTKKINQWMMEIKPLKYIIIIMKYFLNVQQLNITYKDGINTYGIVVMFIAAIKHLKLQKQENIVVMFEKILKYFIYQFDQKVYGIDIRNKKQPFYKKENNLAKGEFMKAELEILDPQNQGKNMTKKCYKYNLIKSLFQKIEKRCFQDQRKQIISSFLKDRKIYCANTHNQLNLKKQSLQTITNGMQNPFITLLKQRQNAVLETKLSSEGEKIFKDKLIEQKECKQEGFFMEEILHIEESILLRTESIKNY